MTEEPADTRERLLDAAAQEFGETGFKRTTISRICARAGANIAAVNYHFGGKERLYRALAERAHALVERLSPLPAEDGDPEQRLREFVRALLGRIVVHEGPLAWLARMWSRELAEPGPMMDLLVELVIRPQHRRLRGIVARLIGRPPEDPLVDRCTASVIGQCMIWLAGRPVLERLGRAVPRTPEELDALAAHIAQFSLGGIRALAAEDGRP